MARADDARPKFREGQSVGRFRILRLIGRGGMAEVYKAVSQQDGGMVVALKAMKGNLDDDRMYLEMFVEEGRLGLLLDHPNLIRTREVNASDRPFIVMDYVGGVDLSRVLRHSQRFGERLSHSEAAYIAHGIASGLAYAHALHDESGKPLNVVNRDVSPQNVRLAIDGSVKVFDFGIARNAQRFTPEVGFVKGKQRYMSPEQLRGHPVDSRSDVFSFGIVFHELLTGRPLFADQDQFQLADSISSARIAPPSKFAQRTPSELDEVCMQCLRQRPEDRVASLSLVLDTLARFAGDPRACRSNLERYLEATFPAEIGQERDDSSKRAALAEVPTATTAQLAPVAPPEVERLELTNELPRLAPARADAVSTPDVPAAVPAPRAAGPDHSRLIWIVVGAAALAGVLSYFVTWLIKAGD